jgi:hypothetical protein
MGVTLTRYFFPVGEIQNETETGEIRKVKEKQLELEKDISNMKNSIQSMQEEIRLLKEKLATKSQETSVQTSGDASGETSGDASTETSRDASGEMKERETVDSSWIEEERFYDKERSSMTGDRAFIFRNDDGVKSWHTTVFNGRYGFPFAAPYD